MAAPTGNNDDTTQYYVAWMEQVEPAPKTEKSIDDIRQDHFAYLGDLEERGVLLAAGPFRDSDGSRHGAGMMIVRASSLAEADAITAEEPYRKHGVRTHKVLPWQWREGCVRHTLYVKGGAFAIG